MKPKSISKNNGSEGVKHLDKTISCHLCEVRFTQRKALYVHLRNKHKIEPLEKKHGTVQCPECKNMFYDKYNLRRHCRKIHNSSPFRERSKMLLRGRVIDVNQKPKFVMNMEEKYSQEISLLNGSNSATETFRDIHPHGNDKYDNKFVTCAVCEENFSSKSTLIKHISGVHSMNSSSFSCTECGEKFSDKQLLLQHTHSLDNFIYLKEILPDKDNFQYEVAQYLQINESSFVSELYCNLCSRNESNRWLEKFQRKNKITFRKMRSQCQSFEGQYTFTVDRYRCQHNTLPKKKSTPHAKHTGCSATLFIRVYQHKIYSQLSWARIRIKHTHNHLRDDAARFRDPIEEVVNKFRLMFQAGKGPRAALKEHTKDLQLLYGDDVFKDKGICPTSRWVYNFYRKMTKQKFDTCEVKIGAASETPAITNEYCGSENAALLHTCQNLSTPTEVSSMLVAPERQRVKSNDVNLRKEVHGDNPSKDHFTNFFNSESLNYAGTESYLKYANQSELKFDSEMVHRVMQEFDIILEQIRTRISRNPTYFVNSLKNFINMYNSTMHTATSLNLAIYNFGKFADLS